MHSIGNKSCFVEGAKILADSSWSTDCLSIHRVYIKDSDLKEFHEGRIDWKHLRMYNCFFDSDHAMVGFLSLMASTLETLVLDQVLISNWLKTNTIWTVVLPKLKKLKSTNFQIDFGCSSLTELALKCPRFLEFQQPVQLLKSNQIKVLTLTYDHVDFDFEQDRAFLAALACIEKLTINSAESLTTISRRKKNLFDRFLMLQSSVKEINIETYFEFNTFILFLKTIIGCIKSLKRLIIREVHRPSNLQISDFSRNYNITELCFERKMDFDSEELFTKILKACSRIKKLKVYNFEQDILEGAFKHMRSLVSIETKILSLEAKPNVVKLTNLKEVKFVRLNVANHPELTYETLPKQNEFILSRLRGLKYTTGNQ